MAELPMGDNWMQGNEDSISIIRGSYCPHCEQSNGITTMLPTKIPYFREIIVISFQCDDCYFKNTEISFGGEIQMKGERIQFTVKDCNDLNRQIIKSDSATVYIPSCYDFEIPSTTQRGTISTIEGFLRSAANNLEAGQPDRIRLGDIDNFHRCRAVIEKLRQFAQVKSDENCSNDNDDDNDNDNENNDNDNDNEKDNEKEVAVVVLPFEEFDIIIDDPAGNSFIENIYAPQNDPALQSTQYYRTPTQDMSLGLQPSADAIRSGTIDDTNPLHKNIVNSGPQSKSISMVEIDSDFIPRTNHATATGTTATSTATTTTTTTTTTADDEVTGIGRKEVITFSTPCANCYRNVETNMCVVDIPHFKEVIIMSLVCDKCGYKSNEIKGGGGIPRFGTEITVTCTTPDDLAREVLKSDTAGLKINELELELSEGGLDGVYTTIEGLLQKLHTRLTKANPFGVGDSTLKQHTTNDTGNVFSNPNPIHVRFQTFLQKLKNMGDGKCFPFTLIITDPLSNSFVGPIPKDAIALSYQAEKDGTNQCYEEYIDTGMSVHEFERTFEQNEILGLNDIKTENYHVPSSSIDQHQNQHQHSSTATSTTTGTDGIANTGTTEYTAPYYGTDRMEELPDRIRRIDVRGPDHPHQVGKAPVEGDTTIMGPGSLNFAVPSIGQRGTKRPDCIDDTTNLVTTATATAATASTTTTTTTTASTHLLQQLIQDAEMKDDVDGITYLESSLYNGTKDGYCFKNGSKGIGYYKDVPLHVRWETIQQ